MLMSELTIPASRNIAPNFASVWLQVFVDHAAFTADQALRRSNVGPLLRTQLEARECDGGGTYTSSPPTSGAAEGREAPERCPQLFDYCVSAVVPVHCDLAGVLSGAQQLGGGGFTNLVVRSQLRRLPPHCVAANPLSASAI